jgi:adenine C2-methylase RlmN of 23S rRNA A2503 and tRNA A37
MINIIKEKSFANGNIFVSLTKDGFPVEITDTFLPFYTKDAIGRKQNSLVSNNIGNRKNRWLIGISCMSGCPVRCKFCSTGKLKKYRNLTAIEMFEQILFAVGKNPNFNPLESQEFKINYTRMGSPFLNIDNVKKTIEMVNNIYPNTHHYISTIGIKGSDFSWIQGNITLQISLHSLDEKRRDELIPYKNKMTIKELGEIRTNSNLKTTVNMTLVDEQDFDIETLKKYFDPKHFFIKLSPINVNEISEKNCLGKGIIEGVNLI